MSVERQKPVTIFAPAKINLFLHVTGKQEHYHTLQSLVAFADFGDDITIEPAEIYSLKITNAPSLANDSDNLITKAAKALAAALGRNLNCAIRLTKNIPMGAGLGGGSADAAATVKALLEFWDSALEPERLNALLTKLGADAPICYHAQAAYFGGIGEVITPVDSLPEIHAVLVYPNQHCSTANIFKSYGGAFSNANAISLPTEFKTPEALIDFIAEQSNDLTDVAVQNIPEIQNILETFRAIDTCPLSRMSGSGSACFGLFTTQKDAHAASEKIQKERSNWWVQPVTLN